MISKLRLNNRILNQKKMRSAGRRSRSASVQEEPFKEEELDMIEEEEDSGVRSIDLETEVPNASRGYIADFNWNLHSKMDVPEDLQRRRIKFQTNLPGMFHQIFQVIEKILWKNKRKSFMSSFDKQLIKQIPQSAQDMKLVNKSPTGHYYQTIANRRGHVPVFFRVLKNLGLCPKILSIHYIVQGQVSLLDPLECQCDVIEEEAGPIPVFEGDVSEGQSQGDDEVSQNSDEDQDAMNARRSTRLRSRKGSRRETSSKDSGNEEESIITGKRSEVEEEPQEHDPSVSGVWIDLMNHVDNAQKVLEDEWKEKAKEKSDYLDTLKEQLEEAEASLEKIKGMYQTQCEIGERLWQRFERIDVQVNHLGVSVNQSITSTAHEASTSMM